MEVGLGLVERGLEAVLGLVLAETRVGLALGLVLEAGPRFAGAVPFSSSCTTEA